MASIALPPQAGANEDVVNYSVSCDLGALGQQMLSGSITTDYPQSVSESSMFTIDTNGTSRFQLLW